MKACTLDRPRGPKTKRVSPERVFRALASRARLCIVKDLIAVKERCVCDLVGCCGLGWSTVSHHLTVLREAGIVADEKRGQQVHYRLAMPCVATLIRSLEKHLDGNRSVRNG